MNDKLLILFKLRNITESYNVNQISNYNVNGEYYTVLHCIIPVAQMAEYLHGEQERLGSIPSIAKTLQFFNRRKYL
jgi:hypothetical protein